MYITFTELKEASAYDPSQWDELDARRPSTIARWLKSTQAAIDDPLRLRYAVPFATTPPSLVPDPQKAPEAVKDWQFSLMDARFLRARREPGTALDEDTGLTAEEKRIYDLIAAAADQDRAAHPELPLRSDTRASGVSKGGPLMIGFSTYHGFFDGQAAKRDAEGW